MSDSCDPVNCSPPGSSHGIFQARVLQWVAISFSRGSSPSGDRTRVSHIVGKRFTVWATREILSIVDIQYYLSYRYIISKGYTPFMKWSEVKVTQLCLTFCNCHELYSPWNSPGQNTGVSRPSLFQGIFPTQGSNPGLPHCRWILNQLRHQGSPRILVWTGYPQTLYLW